MTMASTAWEIGVTIEDARRVVRRRRDGILQIAPPGARRDALVQRLVDALALALMALSLYLAPLVAGTAIALLGAASAVLERRRRSAASEAVAQRSADVVRLRPTGLRR